MLAWVGKLNILRDKVAKYSWELDNSLWDVVRECLVELNTEEKQLTGTWFKDVLRLDVGCDSYLTDCFYNTFGIVGGLANIIDNVPEITKGVWFTIVISDQSSEDC